MESIGTTVKYELSEDGTGLLHYFLNQNNEVKFLHINPDNMSDDEKIIYDYLKSEGGK